MLHNKPWLETTPDGKTVSRPPTWHEVVHRFLVSDTIIQIGMISAVVALFAVLAIHTNATEADRSAAVEEARAALAADLHEDGIPAYDGDWYLELTAFTDPLHPRNPTFQQFEIVGIQSKDTTEVYYLLDRDGYISMLTFDRAGTPPTWSPSYKPGSSELDINPDYELAARCFLSGDFSLRFVPTTPADPDYL